MSEADGPARRRPSRVGRTGARFPGFVDFDDVDDVDDVDDGGVAGPVDGPGGSTDPEGRADPAGGAGPMAGLTGARFNSRGRRDRRRAARIAAEDAAVPLPAPTPPSPMPAGIRVGIGWARRDGGPAPDDAPTRPIFIPAPPEPSPDDRVWVRPYVRTRGRTRARLALAVETLVSLPDPPPVLTDPEHLAIGAICAAPRSVAEVAARVGVPLGVARVLIDDMAASGLLRVHTLSVGRSGTPDAALLRRVLDGLNRL